MSELGDAIARLESGEVWDRLGGRIHADLRAVIAEAKRADALAAVIEEARRIHAPGRTVDTEVMYDDPLGAVLFGAPSDVLVDRDARIRAEVIDWIEAIGWNQTTAREHFGLAKGADRG